MDFPVVKDRGAIHSAAALIADTDARRPFLIRANVGPLLQSDIAGLAGDMGMPADPRQMNPAEQETVLYRLDGYAAAVTTPNYGVPSKSVILPAAYGRRFSGRRTTN